MSDNAASLPGRTTPSKDGVARRKHLRIPVTISTRVRHAAGVRTRRHAAARVVDVSEGGARIEVDHPLAPGEWVSFELPSRPDELRKGFKVPISPADAQRLGLPTGTVRGIIRKGAEQLADGWYALGVVFQKGLRGDLRYWLHEAMPTIPLLLLLVLLFPWTQLEEPSVVHSWYHPVLTWYAIAVSLFVVGRVAVGVAYRPARDGGYTPSVTCIVACKNEEPSIRRTLQCIFRSDYPSDKLHVVAVDDGSTDGTLRELRATARDFSALQIVSLERNLGKRHARAEGARLATGEVLVYVDSDSFVRRDSIRRIVAPFADPQVGAVWGTRWSATRR